MVTRIIAVLLVVALLVAALGQSDDRAKIQGVWSGYVVEGRGERPDRGPVRLSEINIKADRITGKDGNKDLGEGSYTGDVRTNPRQMDTTGLSGEQKGKTYLGIYSLDGDTLKWCTANPGKPRPTEFISRPSAGQFLMVLKRQR